MSKTEFYIKKTISLISDLDEGVQNAIVALVENEVCMQVHKSYTSGFKDGFEFGKAKDDS